MMNRLRRGSGFSLKNTHANGKSEERKGLKMTKTVIVLILAGCLALGGCAGMSDTGQRTLSGGAMGAAGGAIIGAIAGNAGLGAAIGGAVGAGGGYLYGKHKDSEKGAYEQGYNAGKQSK